MQKILHYILASSMILTLSATSFAVETEIIGEELQEIQTQTLSSRTSGSCGDNATWSYSSIYKTLTIGGTGDMWEYEYSERPWNSYAKDITTVVISDGITSISDSAFSFFTNLTSVDFGNTVTKLGDRAFRDCESLVFVEIPNSVTYIGGSCFFSNRNMSAIVPSSVTFIGDLAFNYQVAGVVASMNGAMYGESGSYAEAWCAEQGVSFADIVAKPDILDPLSDTGLCGDSASYIYDGTTKTLTIYGTGELYEASKGDNPLWYHYRDKIKTVVIAEGITGSNSPLFYHCTSLHTVFVPSSMTNIKSWSFHYVDGIVVHPIPNISIYGYGGSVAESFCQEKGLHFVPVTSVPAWAETDSTDSDDGPSHGNADPSENAYPSWATTYINYVAPKIMPDISATNFDDASSRGLIAQSLYNLAGNGQTGISHSFTDAGAYSNAVAWCNANNIMNGSNTTTFDSNGAVTREQFSLILQQLAKQQGKYVSASSVVLDGFSDVNAISSWAKEGMAWAVSNGLMSGSDNKLNPTGGITRTEVAVMLYNFDKL